VRASEGGGESGGREEVAVPDWDAQVAIGSEGGGVGVRAGEDEGGGGEIEGGEEVGENCSSKLAGGGGEADSRRRGHNRRLTHCGE
jgi:hypothetical protein